MAESRQLGDLFSPLLNVDLHRPERTISLRESIMHIREVRDKDRGAIFKDCLDRSSSEGFDCNPLEYALRNISHRGEILAFVLGYMSHIEENPELYSVTAFNNPEAYVLGEIYDSLELMLSIGSDESWYDVINNYFNLDL